MARPRPSTFAYPLVAAALAALVVAQPAAAQFRGFGKNKVRYDEFRWQIYHSPHFDVHFYPEEEHLLKKVVSYAESAYDELSREFDFQIQEPTPLIFYRTHAEFEQNNVILNFIPEGIAAFASPVRNRMVMPVGMPDTELYELILHELTHIFQYQILFQGSLSRAATLRPPQWFMEGMASYMAKDEEAYAKMVLRDAVVNDYIPSVTEGNPQGYFAYRFGHAVFDFIEERWGKEGFRDFLYEFRNTLGGRAGRALERTFRIQPEDFDIEFRRWLRQKYLRRLVETGEPSDFGRPFRVQDEPGTDEISPIASPSGDLVAAFSVQKGDLDIVLFDSQQRRQIKNLTKGITTAYDYLVVQSMTVGRRMGRDLAFSPDGNYLGVFARRDQGRSLLLFDVLNGGISRSIDMDVDQQQGLAWSPDGKTVAFSGARNGLFDIYLLNLDTVEITPLTNDPIFDGSPAFSPDGKSLVFSSDVGGHTKLFRVDLADPSRRFQLTSGDSEDKDAIYSPDGKRIYFTSERDGYDNIFGLDLESGEIRQYTDVVTGCYQPAVVPRPEGRESLVFGGLWRGQNKLYLSDLEQPIGEPQATVPGRQPATADELAAFEPAIEVSIDDANKDKYRGFKFFLTDAQTILGVDDSSTFLGSVLLTFSDYNGDKQILAILSSYDALSNFYINYTDLSHRLQKYVALYDERDFLLTVSDPNTGQILFRDGEIRITGAEAGLIYPFGLRTRAEGSLGFAFRSYPARSGLDVIEVDDEFPYIEAALVGDSTLFTSYGPVAGRRWRLDGYYAPDLENSGSLTGELSGDFRQYLPTSLRTGFAFRAFAGVRFGNIPTPFFIGGESIRGFNFRELEGDHAGFATAEFRFPVIDLLRTPFVAFQNIRGRVFLDVGAIWYDDFGVFDFDDDGTIILRDFEFWDSDENRLKDGIAAYGVGITVHFIGLDLNWDISKRWDFKETLSGFQTTFIIGTRF